MKLFAGLLLALPFVDAIDCGITGYPVSWAYFSKTDANLATQKNCGTLCKKDVKCNSFAVKPQCVESEKCPMEVLGSIVQGRGAHDVDDHHCSPYYEYDQAVDIYHFGKNNDHDFKSELHYNLIGRLNHLVYSKGLHYLDY
ncbi:hypothetical protein TI39_contig4321g00010 [Zymoseptoria brevis]|uniref:Apple domain-containing protein n=1 Tax=Zymoseptoria brevis TaxID=1047168 RepID=A0A0F4G7Q1_9PEZI|nr:hypothetical protein TI39_contig4321g00010 [Zymoseptoria brevis]